MMDLPLPVDSAEAAEAANRSNICAVCGAVSKHFYLNYGAPVCFSCRAFFRRAVAKMKAIEEDKEILHRTPTGRIPAIKRPYSCKSSSSSGSCAITETNRGCKKCRYERCLAAGMKTNMVLDDDGKKQRFRKVIVKHQQMAESETTEAPEEQEEECSRKSEERTTTDSRGRRPKAWSKSKLRISEDDMSSTPDDIKREEGTRKRRHGTPPASAAGGDEGPNESCSPPPLTALDLSSPKPSPTSQSHSPRPSPNSQYHIPQLSPTSPTSPQYLSTASMVTLAQPMGVKSEDEGLVVPNPVPPLAVVAPASFTAAPASLQIPQYISTTSAEAPVQSMEVKSEADDWFIPMPPRLEPSSFTAAAASCQLISAADGPMQYAFPPQSEDITVGNVGVWGGSVDAFGRQDQCVTRCDQLLPGVTRNNPEGSSTSAALQRWIESTAVAAMMEKGLGNWERTLARWQPDKAFADCLVNFHAGATKELPWTLLKEHFSGLAKVFADSIVNYQKCYLKLPGEIWSGLVQRYASLFVHTVLCQYFRVGVYGGDGVEQIKALFCWHMDLELRWDDYGESQLSLPSVTVAQFLRGSRLIRDEDALPNYEAAANDAIRAGLMDKRYFWMVTLASLCVRENNAELERELRDKICEPLLKMHNYFPEAPGPAICCSPIMTTVLAMHKVCNLGQSWIDFGPTPDCQTFDLPYTSEEETWLVEQFNMFDRAYHELELGEDAFKDIMNHSLGVPISRGFSRAGLNRNTERMRNVLKRHEVFSHMTDEEQTRALMTCAYDSGAVMITKLESFETSLEQIESIMGKDKFKDVKQIAGRLGPNYKWKRLTLFDINKVWHLMDVKTMERYMFLIKKLRPLVQDMDSLILMIFVLLFDGVKSPSCRAFQDRYLLLLRRRMRHQDQNSTRRLMDDHDQKDGEQLYAYFQNGLSHIKELGQLLRRIAIPDMNHDKTNMMEIDNNAVEAITSCYTGSSSDLLPTSSSQPRPARLPTHAT